MNWRERPSQLWFRERERQKADKSRKVKYTHKPK